MNYPINIGEGWKQRVNSIKTLLPPGPTIIAGFKFYQRNDGIKWSNDCVFYGNDFERKHTDAELCMDSCAKNPNCYYFTWNRNWYNGTCFLKRKFPPEATPYVLKDCICGYRQSTVCSDTILFL